MNISARKILIPILAGLVTFGACKEKDEDGDLALLAAALLGSSIPVLTGEITSDTTVSGRVLMKGTVEVKNNATLTVTSGTTVFGDTDAKLFIHQGSKLVTQGTASAPVVFTSAKPEGSRAPGDWAGIVMIGKAGTTDTAARTSETLPAYTYGGNTGINDADSSGSIQYTRIEFAGLAFATDKEFNCLSMYGVGSGTTLEYVQCHMGKDDGFEFFGGSVNGKYLLVTGTGDDGFDMDEGYNGKLQYLIAYNYTTAQGADVTSDSHGMEMDGSNVGSTGGATPTGAKGMTNPSIANVTLIGTRTTEGGHGARVREGMQGGFVALVVYGFNVSDVLCNNNAGGGSATQPTVWNYLGDSAQGITQASCTNITDNNTLTAVPFTTAADPTAGTAPNLTPSAQVTGTAATNPNTQFGSPFVSNTTFGAIVGGSDWTQSWSNWKSK